MSVATWTILGTGSLGLTIGWLVSTFIERSPTLEIKALSTVVAIVAGSVTLAVWRTATATALPPEANAYFVGLFVSVLLIGGLRAGGFWTK